MSDHKRVASSLLFHAYLNSLTQDVRNGTGLTWSMQQSQQWLNPMLSGRIVCVLKLVA